MALERFLIPSFAAAALTLCLNNTASAADMPIKAPRMPVAVGYNWTGFYIGANGGYGWGTSSWRDDPALGATDLGSHAIRGGMLGGQVGYNAQFSNWVLGIEADLDWASIK